MNLLTLSTIRILEGLPRLGACRNYVSESIPAFNFTQHTLYAGIWETLPRVLDLVNLLTLSTIRIPEWAHFKPALECISRAQLTLLDQEEYIQSSQ